MQIIDNEIILQDDSLITSKTDLSGRITYANHDFIQISGYSEEELIGANHNIIRHPLMPRIIFKVLWDTIKSGKEINAFVVNRNKHALSYWVYANVTPTFDSNNNIVSYYSVRRKPNDDGLKIIRNVYARLLECESKARSEGRNDMQSSAALLKEMLGDISHQVFFISLQMRGRLDA